MVVLVLATFSGASDRDDVSEYGIDKSDYGCDNPVSYGGSDADLDAHIKISLAANISTSHQQVVFGLLLPCCQHVWCTFGVIRNKTFASIFSAYRASVLKIFS